jgi:hypothetical protein
MHPWRCEHCGWHKPEFTRPDPPSRPSIPAPIARLRTGPLVAAQSSELQP